MKKYYYLTVLCTGLLLSACQTEIATLTPPNMGTSGWQQWVDKKIQPVSEQGHGPDVGSAEWCNTIDFKTFDGTSGLSPCSQEWNKLLTQEIDKGTFPRRAN